MIPNALDHGGPIVVNTTVIHHREMSREDPQFKLRLPPELRAKSEHAAKAAGRSLNAELVARIETSFLADGHYDLMDAKRARELALMARSGIPNEIRRRTVESIANAVKLGRSEAVTRLDDLHLDVGIPENELGELMNGLVDELENAGYRVRWDDITALCVEF